MKKLDTGQNRYICAAKRHKKMTTALMAGEVELLHELIQTYRS